MKKKGKDYEHIVATIADSMYPDSTIKVGSWITGPDGRREVDVEVRRSSAHEHSFILIECKDWRSPVDIEEVDKLESKRHDLRADHAMLVSNSGFSSTALRKCARVGIQAASAIKNADERIRVGFHFDLYAKFVAVEQWQFSAHFAPQEQAKLPVSLDMSNWTYKGLPVQNWISGYSKHLLETYEDADIIVSDCMFREEESFVYNGCQILLLGITLTFQCSNRWAVQTVKHSARLAFWDHVKKVMIVPPRQADAMLNLDPVDWTELEEAPQSTQVITGSLTVGRVSVFAPVNPLDGSDIPPLTDAVGVCHVRTANLPSRPKITRPLCLYVPA